MSFHMAIHPVLWSKAHARDNNVIMVILWYRGDTPASQSASFLKYAIIRQGADNGT
jgi:hypothetical protein